MKECPACRRCFPDHVNHCPDDGDATTLSIAGEPILDGRYQLERRLGHGGMGVVFQARHIFLKTAHAIKVILPDLVGNDPMLVTRFRQEALAAAAIRHPNIIAVTDFGVARGTMPFLVMEYVKGKSLHELLANEGALPPGRALEIMGAIGAGVGAAHRQNIVHRDLKPLNIMMQEDQPIAEGLKVLDFGLAKIKSGELLGSFVQAKTSGLMGSPFYMAPEQWGDEEPDARADIYSLGVILFQMLGGDVPFRGTGIPSIMKKHLTSPPPSFASMGVSVPPQIEAVVRHALEKEAENRPRSVDDFIKELREAVASVTAALQSTSLGPMGMQSRPGVSMGQPSGSLPSMPGEMTVLRVKTNPPQARVFVNNVSVGASSQSGELVVQDMMSGTHYVRVLHDGYAEWEQQIECRGGECRVEAQLQNLSQSSMPPQGDPLAGTISSGTINGIAPQPSVISFGAHASEQELHEHAQRDAIAREELAREEQARLQAQAAAAAAARKREEEERRRAEEEARRKAEEEAARLKAEEEAARLKAEEEARAQAEAEAEAARLRAEEKERERVAEEARQQAALEAKRRAEAEAARIEKERRELEEAKERAAAAEREARELREREEKRQREERRAREEQRKREEQQQRAREEQQQREREEQRAREVEREREAQREREEQSRRKKTVATRFSTQPLDAADLDATQQQRQGVVTGSMAEPGSLSGGGQQTNWQQQQQTMLHSQQPFQNSSAGLAVPKKSALPLILIISLAVLLVGGGISAYLFWPNTSSQQNPSQNPQGQQAGQTEKPPATAIKPDLIKIPGGTFQVGRDKASILEGPEHTATVPPFEMDRTEVTNAEYEVFVRESAHAAPSHWVNNKPLAGQEQWPVNNVSYDDAVAFAAWRSKRDGVTYRLPTEEEWEFAARNGEKDALYPWGGSSWEQGRAVIEEASPKPVGTLPNGKDRWGVVDLIGNVWEWTSSKASLYPGSRGSVPAEEREMMVYRGGSYATKLRETPATATVRNWQKPATTHPTLGFRLVRSGS
jgi:serine/threonine-protein kinase